MRQSSKEQCQPTPSLDHAASRLVKNKPELRLGIWSRPIKSEVESRSDLPEYIKDHFKFKVDFVTKVEDVIVGNSTVTSTSTAIDAGLIDHTCYYRRQGYSC